MAPRLPPVAGVGRPPGGTRIERVGGDGPGWYGVAIADPTAFATLPAEDSADTVEDDGDVERGPAGIAGDACREAAVEVEGDAGGCGASCPYGRYDSTRCRKGAEKYRDWITELA